MNELTFELWVCAKMTIEVPLSLSPVVLEMINFVNGCKYDIVKVLIGCEIIDDMKLCVQDHILLVLFLMIDQPKDLVYLNSGWSVSPVIVLYKYKAIPSNRRMILINEQISYCFDL